MQITLDQAEIETILKASVWRVKTKPALTIKLVADTKSLNL